MNDEPKVISTFKCKFSNYHFGISEYLPILFDEWHFC